ncbi:MAG: hypothetical protein IPJ65_00935 [Archangiaceae bacterium]|nr:hypothetical protein [Archangiaceae bacterium]
MSPPSPRALCLVALLLPGLAFAQPDVPDAGLVITGHAAPYAADWLTFKGQKVLTEDVYRAILHLPADAQPDPPTADAVKEQLAEFLRVTGYELAEVATQVRDGQVEVFIDEGQLEKVVFRGRQTLNSIRFKLALDIPHDVFNRPDLERQVARLSKSLGLENMRLVLVPSTALKHVGPQLEDLPEVKGFEFLHPRRAYELHLVLPDHEWDTGAGIDVRIGYVDGLELRGNWQGRSGIFIDDRWRITAAAAAGLRKHVVTDSLYPHFSRVFFDGEYYFPAIVGTPGSGSLRPAVQARADLVSRLRKDLNLVDYYASELQAAGWLEWEPQQGIRIQFGGGVFDRRIFSLVPLGYDTANLPVGVRGEGGTRPFAALRLELTFDPENERWDRHHVLEAELQQQFRGVGAGPFASARFAYRHVQPFGWHDFWVRAYAFAVWYQSSFHDESSLGEYLHGAFGSEYVRRAASINTEFRFSITRDVLKVGVQSDFALYTPIDRSKDAGPILFATSIGPGLNLLLEGMFQLDVYVTFGLRPNWPLIATQLQNRGMGPGPSDPDPMTPTNPQPYDLFTVGASAVLRKAF